MASLPGFVDLQVNGYNLVDFSSPALTEADFLQCCRDVVSRGTIAFLPTLITASEDTYRHCLQLMDRSLTAHPDVAAHVLGIHVEGPFLSSQPGAVGCHPPALTRAPDVALLERLQTYSGGRIRLLTRWFDMLPDDRVADEPRLCLMKAWAYCFTRGPREAAAVLDANRLEAEAGEVGAEALSIRTMIRAMSDAACVMPNISP